MVESEITVIMFAKDLFTYSPASFIPAIISFLTIPILTKTFSPSEYGYYALTMGAIGFSSIIIESLWGNPLTRFFSFYKKRDKLNDFYGTIIVSSITSIIIISLIFFISLLLIKTRIDNLLYYLLLIGILFFGFNTFFLILRRFLNIKEKSGFYSIFTVLSSLSGFLIGIIMIFLLKLGIVGFLLGNLIAVLFLLPFIYYKSFNGSFYLKNYSKTILHNLLKFGIPLVVSNLAAWILSVSDIYIIEFYRGSLEVGIYSASYGIAEQSITMILGLFMTASYPLIVRNWENRGQISTEKFIGKLTRYYLLISVPAVLGLSILSKPIIQLITSPTYLTGYLIIPLVSLGALFLGLQWWAQMGLILNNRPINLLYIVLISGIINISLNLILVPIYGYIGAAVSTLISYVILFLLCSLISNQLLKWRFPFDSLKKILVASFIMALVVYLVQYFIKLGLILNLVFGITIGLFVYFILLYLFGEIREDELSYIRKN